MADVSATKQAFIERYAPYANAAAQILGMPSAVILAKIAVESKWGQSGLATRGNNLSGLKASGSRDNVNKGWDEYGHDGQNLGAVGVQPWKTGEQTKGGQKYAVKSDFLDYGSPEASIGGLVNFILYSGNKINTLADFNKSGPGGLLKRDAANEAAALDVLTGNRFSTHVNEGPQGLRAALENVLKSMPQDLTSYGIAPNFQPGHTKETALAVSRLPYQPNDYQIGQALNPNGDTDYVSTDIYGQPVKYNRGGVQTARDRDPGISLPPPDVRLDARGKRIGAELDAFPGEYGGKKFSAAEYLNENPDVKEAGVNAVDHAIHSGAAEGRLAGYDLSSIPRFSQGHSGEVSPTFGPGQFDNFDARAYLDLNPDVKAAGVDARTHWVGSGQREDRQFNYLGDRFSDMNPWLGSFDPGNYLLANPDVAKSGVDAFRHAVDFGQYEAGRKLDTAGNTFGDFGAGSRGPDALNFGPTSGGPTGGSPPSWFNSESYLGANPDVAASSQWNTPQKAWEHYQTHGVPENRAIDALGDKFDKNAYLVANPDVALAGFDPWLHYITNGGMEGRAAPLIGPNGLTPAQGPPGLTPALGPTEVPTYGLPGLTPTLGPTEVPTLGPTEVPTLGPTEVPTLGPTEVPTQGPPGLTPTQGPTEVPTYAPPGLTPTQGPAEVPTLSPTEAPTRGPTEVPTLGPTEIPTYPPPGLTPTQGPGGTTPTIGAPGLTPVERAPDATRSWEEEYAKANPDVLANGIDPLKHYLTFGRGEGREINSLGQKFSDTAYLAANPDVAQAGLDPWLHYLRNGAGEGRQASLIGPDGAVQGVNNWLDASTLNNAEYAPLVNNYEKSAHVWSPAPTPTQGPPAAIHAWDADEYRRNNPDVAAAGVDPARHYHESGQSEGRGREFDPASVPRFTQGWGGMSAPSFQPNQFGSGQNGWDPAKYLADNPDVARAGIDPAVHFHTSGQSEGRGREFNPLSVPTFTQGWGGGMSAPTFQPNQFASGQNGWNPQAYLDANPDVKAAGYDPAWHARTYGASEGRLGNFDLGGIPLGAPPAWAQPLGPNDLGNNQIWARPPTAPDGHSPGTDGAMETSVLLGQIAQTNANVQASAAVERQLAGPNGIPIPVFAQNSFLPSGDSNVANNQRVYLNQVNQSLAGLAPQAPAASSFLPRQNMFSGGGMFG